MRMQSADTSPEAERVQIELIRKAPITKRVFSSKHGADFSLKQTGKVSGKIIQMQVKKKLL